VAAIVAVAGLDVRSINDQQAATAAAAAAPRYLQ